MSEPRPQVRLVFPKVEPKKPEPHKIIGGLKQKSKRHYAIPDAVVQQVAEFANGGYYLISFSRKGVPYVTCDADSPAQGDMLKNFCVNYFRSLDKAERELMEKSIFHEVVTGAMRRHPGDKDEDGDGPEEFASI